MVKTKKYYGELVLNQLYPVRGKDEKVDAREVIIKIDEIVNRLARENFFNNWTTPAGMMIDEGFITTWDGDNAIDVEEDANGGFSYIDLPATPASILINRGIEEIWPLNYDFGSVKIMQHRDLRLYRNNMAGNLQGELGGAPQGTRFIFNQCEVGKKYSRQFGVRLVIRDSGSISDTAPYPIPSDVEDVVITTAVEWFMARRATPADQIKDNNDKP